MRLRLRTDRWAATALDDGQRHSRLAPGGACTEVLVRSDHVVLSQDVVRSFPLFYAPTDAGEWCVSDDIRVIVAEIDSRGLSELEAAEFRHLGFVPGAATLHPGILQVQSGESIELRDGARPRVVGSRSLGTSGENIRDDAAADERFSAALSDAFTPLLDRLNGRQVVVPLSGGLDSRLIALVLKDVGYDNVVNFTYGVGETAESRISRTVAAAVQQRWEFVPYDVQAMRAAWASPQTADFVKDSYAAASLPHIQDWYALQHLRAHGLIDTDAVFLPGHTVVGNMHDESILDSASTVPAQTIRKLIVRHHAVLQPGGAASLAAHSSLAAKVDEELSQQQYDGSPLGRLLAIENWNLRERQAKYINNSMRAYEHFCYEWALPMLEDPVLDAWESFDISIRRDRSWYARYIARRYEAATGTRLATFAPTSLGSGARAMIKSALRATGLLQIAERRFAARTYATHPMGFQAFVPASDESELRRAIMRGGSPFGVFADRFLADAWAPHQSLFS